ncbi:Na/Pi cotransporter family protein [Paracoccus jiaweipingae]|uniref:Na/Pi cotransporter family protein n=1 Tax=unclassified Paracoccus (in: a-proteobacteria) TaxID=2688777 RepID=UPI0037B4BEE8
MGSAVFGFLGGLGLFLFGMEVMTTALRDLAGPGLRHLLARFTTSPLRGVLTGLAATAVVQSSTAVTVMTIGFVGAGILGFVQALGILFGANIGTTLTGWIVVFLGFRLHLGQIALPALFVASLMAVLGRGRVARLGRMLAGMALLFIGLDMMQDAASGLGGLITPGLLPGDGLWGRLALVGLGTVLVMVMMSSSAGLALALVLLGSGAISFAQAAALVVGMNIGTTFTAILAAIGGARPVRMTALANLLFNLGTALLAFPVLSLLAPLLHATPLGADDQTALVLFHSSFNIAGTLAFLPFTHGFARLIERLVPQRPTALAEPLDPHLLADPAAALDAAQSVCDAVARRQAQALAAALTGGGDLRPLAALSAQTGPALAAIETYLAQITIPLGQGALLSRYTALLHQLDHLSRLHTRLQDQQAIAALRQIAPMRRPAQAMAAALTAVLDGRRRPDGLEDLAAMVAQRGGRVRQALLAARPATPGAGLEVLFQQADAVRWLGRVAAHLSGLARHRASALAAPGAVSAGSAPAASSATPG